MLCIITFSISAQLEPELLILQQLAFDLQRLRYLYRKTGIDGQARMKLREGSHEWRGQNNSPSLEGRLADAIVDTERIHAPLNHVRWWLSGGVNSLTLGVGSYW